MESIDAYQTLTWETDLTDMLDQTDDRSQDWEIQVTVSLFRWAREPLF